MTQTKTSNFFLFIFSTTLLCLTLPIPSYCATPPPLQLANIYNDNHAINLEDYWVSEKLDGVRAYWDGSQFISRQGNRIHPPNWFIEKFPAQALDGELWIGHHQFELVSGIVRQKKASDDAWRKIRFMVFDMPKNPDIFSQRLTIMEKLIHASGSEYLQLVTQRRVKNHENLIKQLHAVVEQGGEGLMLHRGKSHYRPGRNNDMLKVKLYNDAEAIVIAHLPGKGKYAGMLGALLVENSDKLRFKIGSGFTDAQRKHPPKIGSIITYKYVGKTKNNLPKFTSFLRVRTDL